MCKVVENMINLQSKTHKIVKLQALIRCCLIRKKYKKVLG